MSRFALGDLAACPIGAQFIGAIDPHSVDDVVAVIGDDVEQVDTGQQPRAP